MSAGREGDTVTVVRDAGARALTKRYSVRGGRLVKSAYPNVAQVFAEELPVHGIESLAAVLDDVTAGGTAAVIRGAPGKFYPRNGAPAFRLLRPQEGQAVAKTGARVPQEQIRKRGLEPDGAQRHAATWLPTFEDRPRSWVILDVDRVPVPSHLADDWVDDPDPSVEHVLGMLPPPFRTATCWWSLSSSAAVPGRNGREVSRNLRLKLAFWLDRSLTGPQMKRWMAAERAPVDPAVFGAVQLIYLARPGFGPGLHDPVPRRSGIFVGEDSIVTVPTVLPDPPAEDARGAPAFGPAEGLDDLRAALRTRLAGEIHVREHLLTAARAYMRRHEGCVDQAALTEVLEDVALEYRTPAEVAGYGVDRLVDHVARQERTAPHLAARQAAPPARLPPYFDDEAPDRDATLAAQRATIADWLERNWTIALARREIRRRRDAAFAAEGLL